MFEGFALETVDLPEASLRVRRGGSGPAVLLLHGHPRTHATWHRVAPLLAGSHAVVCPDLRGYGGSSKPPTTADHAPYSKRAMAGDCVALMRRLGHERFAVVGHDRGAYVAFRTAMDHPGAVGRLVVLDAVPIVEALERCDARFAASWWHWFFFAQPDKPERAILADPDAWYGGSPERMGGRRTRTTGPPSTTRRRSTPWWRTTAPGSASTGRTTRRTGARGGGSPARRSSCGRGGTTWRTCTATRWRCGAPGRPS